MATPRSDTQNGSLYGHPANRVTLTCAHGASTYVVLPGGDSKANLVAHDLLWARHTNKHRCDCGPLPSRVDVS